jgi:hypothetical protein
MGLLLKVRNALSTSTALSASFQVTPTIRFRDQHVVESSNQVGSVHLLLTPGLESQENWTKDPA